MGKATHIAGDWGTSRLRLYLCDGDAVIDRASGPGAVGVEQAHEAILMSRIAPWLAQWGPLPVLLCGMVGSRSGWVEAPYAPCPADAESLRARLTRFEAEGTSIAIVPGVAGTNAAGAPDIMRGEETQIVGALALEPDLATGRRLVAHPGTHTKWALLEDGVLTSFQTAPTGELFALLRDRSTLVVAGGDTGPDEADGFAEGLARRDPGGPASLTHALFEARSRQIIDGWSAARARDFLSGLLIADDVAGGLAAFGAQSKFGAQAEPIVLLGDPLLTGLYGQALARRGAASRSLDGEACVLAGLKRLFSLPVEGVRNG